MKDNESVTSQKLESETEARGLRRMPRTIGLSGTMVVVLKSMPHGISHLSASLSNGPLF